MLYTLKSTSIIYLVDTLEVPITSQLDCCRRLPVTIQDAISGGQSPLNLATMLLSVVIHIFVAIDKLALIHIAPVDAGCFTISGHAHSRAHLRSVQIE